MTTSATGAQTSAAGVRLPVYLDHSATTPLDPRAFEAMRPYFTETFGNAASTHGFGKAAAAAVARARNQVAALLNVERDEPDERDGRAGAREIIWTSGATEANNLAIKGVAASYREKGRHIVTQVTEHKSVIDPCRRLAAEGYEITWLQPDRAGRVSAAQVHDALRPDTVLASIMWANNELGTIQPVAEIGAACRDRGVLFHTDATQAIGKIPVDVEAAYVDLLSFTGHKFYGPKGTGGLFVRRRDPRVHLEPLFDGGGHERGFRSGTLNVPGIVAIGVACDVARETLAAESARQSGLRDRLERALLALGGVTVNGDTRRRLPNLTNLAFAGVDDAALMAALDDLAVSSGSACSSASAEASYVLRAIGVPPHLARNAIRFSLGRSTTEAEVDYAIARVSEAVQRLRAEAK